MDFLSRSSRMIIRPLLWLAAAADENPMLTPLAVVVAACSVSTAWFYVATGTVYNGLFTFENFLSAATVAVIVGSFLIGNLAGKRESLRS